MMPGLEGVLENDHFVHEHIKKRWNTSKNISHNYSKSLAVGYHKTRLQDNHFSSCNTGVVFFFRPYIFRNWVETRGKRRSGIKGNFASKSHMCEIKAPILTYWTRVEREDRRGLLPHPGENTEFSMRFNSHIWISDNSHWNIKCSIISRVPTMCQWLLFVEDSAGNKRLASCPHGA